MSNKSYVYFSLPLILLGLATLILGQLQISFGGVWGQINFINSLLTVLITFYFGFFIRSLWGLKIFTVACLCSFGTDVFLSETGISDDYYDHRGLVSVKLGGISVIYWVLLIQFFIYFSKYNLLSILKNKFFRWYLLLGVYFTVVGVVNIILGGAFSSINFLKDFIYFFAPAFFIIIYINLSEHDILQILIASIVVVFIGLFTSYLIGSKMFYGGLYFHALPNFYNWALFLPIFFNATVIFSFCYILFWILIFIDGIVFSGVKTYLGLLLVIFSLIGRKNRFLLLSVFVLFFISNSLLDDLIGSLLLNDAAAHKISQVFDLLNPSLLVSNLFMGGLLSSSSEGSLFNIVSELYVILTVKPFVLTVAGSGFGSLVQDSSGLLSLGGLSAYSPEMLSMNAFTDFHLPFLMILHWGGLAGTIFYFKMLHKAFSLKPYGVFILVIFLFIFFSKFVDQLVLISVVFTLFLKKQNQAE